MRLTNVMMTNTTLMHINRNMRNLDSIIRSIETGKRVQRPSDNPIIASRALMFRTSVHENAQFQRNVDQGVAWMNVTETTFDNINRELLLEMRRLAVQGANHDNNLDNMQAIIRQMQSLFDQVGHEMNATFGGNYLFSGFRTDEPPIFTENNNRSFVITQHFSLTDISRQSSFQRLVVDGGLGTYEPVTHQINVLKLAYSGLDTEDFAAPPDGQTWPEAIEAPTGIYIPGFHIRKVSITDPTAYTPEHFYDRADGTRLPIIHFIPETGELVMHRETALAFPREGVSVTYEKTGFRKGDINPKVYFTGREITANTSVAGVAEHLDALGDEFGGPVQLVYNITQYFSRAAGVPIPAVSPTHFDFQLAFDVYAEEDDPAVNLRPNLPPGAVLLPGNIVRIPAQTFNTHSNVSVTYAVSFINSINSPFVTVDSAGNTLDPPVHIKQYTGVQGVELVRALGSGGAGVPIPRDRAELNASFNMHNQDIQYEFAPRTHITVNSLAKNVLTDKMFSDFRRFFEFADSLRISERVDLERHFTRLGYSGEELEDEIEKQLVHERGVARDALFQQFNNMLFLIDRHADNSMREQTQLGARMVRLELVQNRLEQDEVTYERLTSGNEDTDLIHATILRFSAEAIFMASLHANSGVIQMSLANFLR